MAFTPKDNTGSLFKNKFKEKDSQPDYKGDLTIGGTTYQQAAWIKKDKNGNTFMSFSYELKGARKGEDNPPQRQQFTKPESGPQQARPSQRDAMEDEIPW